MGADRDVHCSPLDLPSYAHVSEFPLDKNAAPLSPKWKEVCAGMRDTLGGQCWAGAACKVGVQAFVYAEPHRRKEDHCLCYQGSSGVAVYSVGLKLLCYLASAMLNAELIDSILAELVKAGQKIESEMEAGSSNLIESLFKQIGYSHSTSNVNRKPSDFMFVESLEWIGAAVGQEAVGPELLDKYNHMHKERKDCQIPKAAAARVLKLADADKFHPTARTIVRNARHVCDDEVHPVSRLMTEKNRST